MSDKELKDNNQDKISNTALLGLSVISVVQMLGTATLDFALTASLYCFAVAIPLLATSLWVIDNELKLGRKNKPWYCVVVGVVGVSSAGFGLFAVFWHFSRSIALVFGIAYIVGVFVYVTYERSVEESSS